MRYTAVNQFGTVKVRPGHDTLNVPLTGDIPIGTLFNSDITPFIAPVELKDTLGNTVQMVNDEWLNVTALNKTGWIAIRHMGKTVCTLVDNQTPAPVSTTPDLPVHIELGDNVTYVKQMVDVVLKGVK